jgi:hypothetical protein
MTVPTKASEESLRLPSFDEHPEGRPLGVLGWVAMSLNAVAVAVVALLYLLISPLVALATGFWSVVTETRDTVVRPRPFVGADHGLPFLDPAPPPPPPPPPPDED